MRLLKWQNTDKGKDFIKQGIEGAKQERERNDAANAARDSKMAAKARLDALKKQSPLSKHLTPAENKSAGIFIYE